MTTSVSFKTRARTIDHLGREQIADCPTAVSELWKNSYDAYARHVELHIFDGEIPVATLVDDGHGMSRDEFESKWLTVGTDSKFAGFEIPIKDRDGLPERPKQGQKGIGRLSCAALGALLLIISKREKMPFVASLIDWRLFENPFLMLEDIRIPIIEIDSCYQLCDKLPGLFDTMMGNVWGDGDSKERDDRLTEAWKKYSDTEADENVGETTKDKIVNTLIADVFDEQHFATWSVWKQISSKGTAMFMAGIHPDLEHQTSKVRMADAPGDERRARERMQQTLVNFVDIFQHDQVPYIQNFSTSVLAWNGQAPRSIIEASEKSSSTFTRDQFDQLEHIIEGMVDEAGYFRGRIKAFGEWHENVTIKAKTAYKTRKDTEFGSFSILIGGYEGTATKSSMPADVWSKFDFNSELYGGLKVYRDHLRVMPYGREDNDYFEIEKRRTNNAGRYFWSARKTFGCINISRSANPNLKDKAGREGLIDNKASKLFREIVEHILIKTAEDYLGRRSKIRQDHLEEVKIKMANAKAVEDRKKLLAKERLRLRRSIKENMPALVSHLNELQDVAITFETELQSRNIEQLHRLKNYLDNITEKTRSFSLSPIPHNLGTLEKDYREYRKLELEAQEYIKRLNFSVNKTISESRTKSDYDIAEEIFRSKTASLNAAITRFSSDGQKMLAKQTEELKGLVKECREQFKIRTIELLEDLKLERISLDIVLNKLDEEQEKTELENAQKLSPYITALERINEQIDLEGLAIQSMNESIKYRDEIGRLHALAQLGITVEIIGHEIEGLDMTITRGLKTIAEGNLNPVQSLALDSVNVAQQALSDKWRFLSPLKLSGEKVIRKISGQEIMTHVKHYFHESLSNRGIDFNATDSFLSLSLQEIPSRIYPVFVNLVNNAQYWVDYSDITPKRILLDATSEEVFIADTGPGVSKDDLELLFTLFFTTKQRGGRGVGLYLCRQNLAAGGHTIRYIANEDYKLLPGANFSIAFKGMKK